MENPNPRDFFRVPEKKFRLYGWHTYEYTFFVVDDYESLSEARAVARTLRKKDKKWEKTLGTAIYEVMDSQQNVLFKTPRNSSRPKPARISSRDKITYF